MPNLGQELQDREAEIINRWYEAWQNSPHPHPGVGEAALKDQLPDQLRLIGVQLQVLATAEPPSDMWKIGARAQGGTLDVVSELGKCSTFSLCLPRFVAPREQ